MVKRIDGIYARAKVIMQKPENKRRLTLATISLVIISLIVSLVITLFVNNNANAAPVYHMATGRYVGSGSYKQVSGLGFAPEAVMIKAATTAGVGAMLKTNSMIDNSVAYLGSATADDANGLITLDTDGFTVTGTNSNTANTSWTWAAWGGSDCSASGQFCIGRYTGNGTSPRLITPGFQPDIALVKNTAATTAANFQTVGMTANYGQYFMAAAQDTTGALFTSFSPNGFNVGATNNTSAAIYNFVAFKNVAGSVNVGSFTGNGTSQPITSAGFSPEFVIVKNTTGTAVSAVYNSEFSYGDSSSLFTDAADLVGAVTGLTSNGFNVGTQIAANGSGNLIFWMAFNDMTSPGSSGTFKMASGTYVGNGQYQNINGLSFVPDLVIIKGNTTQAGVFRTAQHNGDVTSYLDAATADFTLGIQSLNPDGFNIGTAATVNTNAVNYYWTAYGNAWRPATNSGASDFVIGTYYGNGIDNRNITGLPFQPDMVVIKRSGASAATFRTSAHSGDSSSFFAATADAANNIQNLNSDGFQIGTAANVNTAANFYRYFAFKNGTNFTVNTYSGNGSTQNITTPGFQPDFLWVKATGATRGVEKHVNMAAASCAPFINVAEIATAFSGFISTGFGLTNAAETNSSGTNNYRYAAWKNTNTVTAPSYHMATGRYVGSGNYKSVSGLGFAPEAVIVKASTTAGVGAFLKTTSMIDNTTAYLGSATADDANGLITLDNDGFTVIGANANTANVTWAWAAWGGSDCSATGQFCVGDYLGNGTSPRTIATGFQPDIAIVKRSTNAVAANFQTVGMTANYGQYFMATAQDTSGALFGSLQSNGFQVGATNNTSSGIYHFVVFKNISGSINVGSFSGNGTSQTISSLGFDPDFVIAKNTTGTAVSAVFNSEDSYGDSSNYFTDLANVVGAITALGTGGAGSFSVGANAAANGSGNLIFWIAFNDSNTPTSSGTFKMASGTYVGNGQYQNINGLSFAPDLVIIKGNTTAAGVFRTTQHNGDVTSYLDAATADFALGIQSLNPDGFNIGTSATINTNAVNYYWTAYGNAWRPATNSGASDFVIGTYYGNGIDNRNITGLPFQPNMVAIKGSGAQAGTFRTSSHAGDLSSFFAATAEAANNIQALNSDGFQVGTAANVNTAATFYRYFAFKNGTNFTVNTYSGNGSTQNITTPGFQPDFLWVKATGATRGVEKHVNMAAANSAPFINVAEIATAFSGFISTGFGLTNAAETNSSGSNNYRYAAWRVPVVNQNPNLSSSLTQKKTDDSTIVTGQWVSTTSIKYTATVSDPDADQVQLCVEKDALGTSFSNTEDLCGSLVASGLTASVQIDSQTDATEYHWQARAKDSNGAYSSWQSYPDPTPNGEGERDYGLDTTAPAGGSVYDGTSGDQDWNDGSLTQISGNWTGFDSSASGLNKYEYAIRRKSDDYYWSVCSGAGSWQLSANWCNNSTSTSFTQNNLNLQTGVIYYLSVRTTDNASNLAAAVNSNGQQVSPTLSFSYDTNVIDFANLNNTNNWTDTKSNTFTVSTNAYLGYTIRGYINQLLTSLAYPSITIPNFSYNGASWSSPQLWPNGQYGFGYTSNDNLVQGSNRFASGTQFAPFSQTASGDVVADHTSTVDGSTGAILNEQFIVTYKVAVSQIQAASTYRTYATYVVTANY